MGWKRFTSWPMIKRQTLSSLWRNKPKLSIFTQRLLTKDNSQAQSNCLHHPKRKFIKEGPCLTLTQVTKKYHWVRTFISSPFHLLKLNLILILKNMTTLKSKAISMRPKRSLCSQIWLMMSLLNLSSRKRHFIGRLRVSLPLISQVARTACQTKTWNIL